MSDMQQLSLENIRNLDLGVIARIFDAEVSRLVKDCEERPALDKPRRLALVFSFTPEMDRNAMNPACESVEVTAQVQSTVPKQVTSAYRMLPKKLGRDQMGLIFRPSDPTDPTADELYDDDVRERERDARDKPRGRPQTDK